MTIHTAVSPLDLLMPYQKDWVDDDALFKFGLWARQTGKDFSSACEIARDLKMAQALDKPAPDWLIAAPSERQSLESLAKVGEWMEAFDVSIADIREEREGGSGSLLQSKTIELPNGPRVIAVPGRPQTVRGFSAACLITEADFFEDIKATWRALLPSITNIKRGGRKKVRLITTPNGKSGMAWNLYKSEVMEPDPKRKLKWSYHRLTIENAVAAGLEVDIEMLREAYKDDPDGFAQECMCEFLDGSNVLLPYDIIALAESFEATQQVEASFWDAASSGPIYLGIDFGRTNDPTVCWAFEDIGGLLVTREVLVLRNVKTPDQQEQLARRIRRAQRVSFDYTGPGIGLGDYLAQDFGEYKPTAHQFGKIELCTFTVGFKRDIFPKLRRAFEAPTRIRIPNSTEIREDLHEVRQIITNGQYNYAAPRTAEGHSDRCTALALALRAADQGGTPFSVSIIGDTAGSDPATDPFYGIN